MTELTPLYIQEPLLIEDPRYEHFKTLTKHHYDSIANNFPTMEYRPYQYELAANYALRSHNICAGSCGLGKTIIVGLLITALYNFNDHTRAGKIQIAVPNKLSGMCRWLVDLNRIPALANQVEFISTPAQLLHSTKPIWVYTQDLLKRNTNLLKGKRNTLDRLIIKRGRQPSLLVVDEIHLLKPDSQRSKHWSWFVGKTKRFLALSGTLSDGRVDLLAHITSLAYGKYMPCSKSSIEQEFRVTKPVTTNYLKGEEEVASISTRYLAHLDVTKLPEYADFSQKFIHRVSLNDPDIRAVVKLPTYTEHEVKVAPHFNHKKAYLDLFNTIKSKLIAVQNSKWTLALNIINPLIQCSAFTDESTLSISYNRKFSRLLHLVNTCTGKTVIFANQVATARRIHQELLNNGYNEHQAIRLYAQDPELKPKVMSSTQREDLVTKFLCDPDVKVGVFSINLAAESIDLNTASQVIFYDYPWQAIKVQQAIFRAVRPGSPVSHIDIYYLVNSGMIDEHQYSLLNERKKSTVAMLDFDPTALRGQDLNVINTSELIQRSINSGTSMLDQILAEYPF